MNSLKISLFGGFTISLDDLCLDVKRSRRQMRLLVHLILNRDRVLGKRELVDICFGYGEYAGRPKASLNALNALFHRLRASLSKVSKELSDSIVCEGGSYRMILTQDCEIDTELFEELSTKALACTDLSEAKRYALDAISLYTGSFLDGEFSDSSLKSRAQSYASTYLRLVELVCRILWAHGDLSSVESLSKRAIAIDPLCESFRYERLSVLCEIGRTNEAVELYNETVRIFAEKLSIAPSKRFRDLGEALFLQEKEKTVILLSSEHEHKAGEIQRVLARVIGAEEKDISVIIK